MQYDHKTNINRIQRKPLYTPRLSLYKRLEKERERLKNVELQNKANFSSIVSEIADRLVKKNIDDNNRLMNSTIANIERSYNDRLQDLRRQWELELRDSELGKIKDNYNKLVVLVHDFIKNEYRGDCVMMFREGLKHMGLLDAIR